MSTQLLPRLTGALLYLLVSALPVPPVESRSPDGRSPAPAPHNQTRRDPISGVPLPPPAAPLERRDPYSGLPLPRPLAPLERRDPFSGVPLDPGHPNYGPGRDHIHGDERFDEPGWKPKHYGDEHRRRGSIGEESRQRRESPEEQEEMKERHRDGQDRSPGFP